MILLSFLFFIQNNAKAAVKKLPFKKTGNAKAFSVYIMRIKCDIFYLIS